MSPSSATTRTWKMTLLSPLHLGDGKKLFYDIDFLVQPKEIEVIDFNVLTEQLVDIPKAINDLSKDVKLERIIQDYKLSAKPVLYTMKYSGGAKPKEIRSFLKNAFGEPYIAGSSLKGAIHTALWTGLDMSSIPSPRAANEKDYKSRFRKVVEKVGGEDPYHMFIRPLQVSDSTGLIPQGNLVCEEIKFFNLQKENQPGWKDFSGKGTVSDFGKASGMHVETLHQGVSLVMQVHIDPLLAKDEIRHIAGIKRSEHVSTFDRMIGRIREHSRNIAARELDFFRQYGNATRGVVDFYNRLIRQMDAVLHKPETFILRMAWGSGWRGMTGDWIADDDMAFIRDKGFEKLGKAGVQVFPKTRRLAIDPSTGTPALPLGWVLVEPAASDAFHQPFRSAVTHAGQTGSAVAKDDPAAPVKQVPPVPKIDPQTLEQEKLNHFQKRLDAVKSFQSEVVQFIQSVQKETNPDIKRRMSEMLYEKAKALPNKAYTTALKENKRWATLLKQLVDETQ